METSLARDLMSDEEWAFHERFILAIRAPNGRKPTNHRVVLDGIFWVARTGSPWRDLPEEFGKWSSVYRQFRRWTLAGLWEGILEALNESGLVPDALQMIDSTVVRAHHQAADAKVRLRYRVLAVRTVASRPIPTSGSMDLPRKCGERQLRNQEVFYGKRKQTDAGVPAGSGAAGANQRPDAA